MPSSIAVLLGIGLTFYILSLMGTIGMILGIIIIAWYVIFAVVWKKMDSHDKRFDQIIQKAIEYDKSTTGQEFKIKPIKFKDELERTRYADSNYLQKDNDRIIIKHHYLDKDYNVCRVEIINNDNIAKFSVKLIDDDTLEVEYKEEDNLKKEYEHNKQLEEKKQEEMDTKLNSLIDSLHNDNSKKK